MFRDRVRQIKQRNEQASCLSNNIHPVDSVDVDSVV
jgi:hypothetical protein